MWYYVYLSGLWPRRVVAKYRSKKVAVSDSILVDTVALNPSNLRIKDMQGNTIDPLLYSVDYPNALVFPSENVNGQKRFLTYRLLGVS